MQIYIHGQVLPSYGFRVIFYRLHLHLVAHHPPFPLLPHAFQRFTSTIVPGSLFVVCIDISHELISVGVVVVLPMLVPSGAAIVRSRPFVFSCLMFTLHLID